VSAPKHRKAQPRHILAAQAADLRAQGLSGLRIAAQLGISKSYAYELINDPSGEKNRKRKDRYRGICVDCGAPTTWWSRIGPAKRCRICSPVYLHETYGIWSRERVIMAVQAWADEHGGIPPTAADWNPNQAIKIGRPEKAEKFYADGAWPHVHTVMDYFGGWNAAITAAGFESRHPGHYGRENEGFAERTDIVAMYLAGMSMTQIADELGVHPKSVKYQLTKRGITLRSTRETRALQRAA
jgi:DNA-binding CsgD family transcriptional regulator